MTTVPMEPVAAPEPRWRALRGTNVADRLYRTVLTTLALLLPLLLLALVGELAVSAWPAIRRFGLSFLWTSVWDPVAGIYGAAPMIFGTLASSLLALLIAVPLSLGVAIYLTEFAPKWLRQPVAFLVELLAAIPSVVYGLWGIFVLIPFLRTVVVPPLRATLGWTPFLSGVFYGNSLLAGSVILAIMIVPYIAAVSREVLLAVPVSQREAALGMGAGRCEHASAAPPPGQRHHDRPGSRAVLGGGPRPSPDSRASRRERRVVSRLELFRQESRPGRAIGRRRGQRDRRDSDHRGIGRADRPADRHRDGTLSRGGRLRAARLDRAVRGGRPERYPIDRGRHLRLDLAREADGPLLRARRERGARGADGADAGPHHRGDGAARPPLAARGRPRPGLSALAHLAPRDRPHRPRRDRHRLPRGHRARRGGDRPAAFHGARQPELLDERAATHADAVAPDLRVRHRAIRRVAPSRLGGGARVDGTRVAPLPSTR